MTSPDKPPLVRSVAWVRLGTPSVSHLVTATVYPSGPSKPEPLCQSRKPNAIVYREDGMYCRYCIVQEGVL